MHGSSFKNRHFVRSATHAKEHNNNKSKDHFILFLIIKYWRILRMSSRLIELWSTEKSYTVPFNEISPCSSLVKSFDTLPKQKLYQIMLSFALSFQISVLFTYK